MRRVPVGRERSTVRAAAGVAIVALLVALSACALSDLPPIAALLADVSSGTAPLAVRFDGSGSTGRGSPIVSFVWQFGDGDSASGSRVTHTYASPGSYTVELIVIDRRGREARAATTITVEDRSVPREGCVCFAEPFHPNAQGDDNAHLNDEYVTVRNDGPWDVDMAGWTVGDEGGHLYHFPAGFVLAAGASVSIHTGVGGDTADVLHWGWHEEIWTNRGDIAILRDPTGRIVSLYAYMDAAE
jgi:PKD repeat protein